MGAADDIERGQLSCSYKRSFSVRSAGALFRKKDYVIVLDCHSNTIVMHKQRSGEQIKNEVSVDDCLQIEKSNRDETQGNFTFRLDDSDKVKVKSFYFDTYDNRGKAQSFIFHFLP